MKKTIKVYSASDFVNASVSMAVEDSYWQIDTVTPTREGKHSGLPLFKVGLKPIQQGTPEGLPEGFRDGSSLMDANRTYFVREGRPLYTDLIEVWKSIDGDEELFPRAATSKLGDVAFKGHVERLTGVKYTKLGRNKTVVTKARLELWYPSSREMGEIVDDFVHLCNKGVYTPIIDQPTSTDAPDPLAGIDPSVIAAIAAALGKK